MVKRQVEHGYHKSSYQSTKVGGEIETLGGRLEGIFGEKALTFSLPAKMLARYQLRVESLAPLTSSEQIQWTCRRTVST